MSKLRSVFISDVHLGGRFANTGLLLEFLKEIREKKPENLYLVGDFIDGWKLKRNWYWDNNATLVIRKILSFVKHGTKVYYVAGNHDEFLRTFISDFHLDLGNIYIADEFIHIAPDGSKNLVIHGDRFDTAIRFMMKYAKWLCTLGDIGYGLLIRLNSAVNWFRRQFGFPYWSLSKAVKSSVKTAGNFVGGFETLLADYAKERECAGVICGHIHTPALKSLNGINYYNCGDWVESCSAIMEYHDGKYELYHHEMKH
jgi:UDP-2,3-diacylglucosamine pyrophosphatase LpxH